MNTTFVRLAIAAILTVAATASYAEIDTYRAHGTIQNIDAASGKVTLMQDPVPALGWPGRTMTYRVDGKNILNGIQAGQKVDVQFSTTSPYDASAHFVTPAGQ